MTRAEIIPDTAARLFKVYLVGTWGREWIGNYETMDSAERVARAAENETIRDSRY